jgi:hypothetical protein
MARPDNVETAVAPEAVGHQRLGEGIGIELRRVRDRGTLRMSTTNSTPPRTQKRDERVNRASGVADGEDWERHGVTDLDRARLACQRSAGGRMQRYSNFVDRISSVIRQMA